MKSSEAFSIFKEYNVLSCLDSFYDVLRTIENKHIVEIIYELIKSSDEDKSRFQDWPKSCQTLLKS